MTSDKGDGRTAVVTALHGGQVFNPNKHGGGNGGGDRSDGAPPAAPQLPDDCPVLPLGRNGDWYYYLDAANEMRTLKHNEHGRLPIVSLFGDSLDYLYAKWPRHDKDGKLAGIQVDPAAYALMAAAAKAGPWDAMGRVRGRGAWRGPDGELIFHCGDTIWLGPDQMATPGLIGDTVYPAGPRAPRPAEDPQKPGEAGPAHEVLDLFGTWRWQRGEIDALLMLGWVAAAMLGGALDWRPMCWVTGDSGSGKSTLHGAIHGLLGAVLSSSAASAAGIWQKVGYDSLPVELDEAEASDDNRKLQAVIELARQAASGGVILRGGADHKGVEFTARNCFLFSSINIPPLLTQDLNRMAILELQPLDGGNPPDLVKDVAALGVLGRRLRRRLADGWQRFPDILEIWRARMTALGHGTHTVNQFGTLLACADLLLHDHLPDTDSLEGWTDKLSRALLAEDNSPDWARCIQWLVTSSAEVWRGGGQDTVGHYVRQASGMNGDIGVPAAEDARAALDKIGLKLTTMDAADGGGQCLAVANSHRQTVALFADSHWKGKSGATSTHVRALRRVLGAKASKTALNVGGGSCRCTLIPLDRLFDDGGTGAPKPATEPAAEIEPDPADGF